MSQNKNSEMNSINVCLTQVEDQGVGASVVVENQGESTSDDIKNQQINDSNKISKQHKNVPVEKMRKIKSFVRRDGRLTQAQQRALQEGLPLWGLDAKQECLDLTTVFGREAPRILEIGFGAGHSLFSYAKANPDKDFIGIETHLPGVGQLLISIAQHSLTNIRIFNADAVEVLTHCIPAASLDSVQIFFPDPWPKRRHHKRRLVQTEFVNLIVSKLKPGGCLHLATDWEHYAKWMMKVLSDISSLHNMAGVGHYAERSLGRPVITKFEKRGNSAGRKIWELQFNFAPADCF